VEAGAVLGLGFIPNTTINLYQSVTCSQDHSFYRRSCSVSYCYDQAADLRYRSSSIIDGLGPRLWQFESVLIWDVLIVKEGSISLLLVQFLCAKDANSQVVL